MDVFLYAYYTLVKKKLRVSYDTLIAHSLAVWYLVV